LVLASLFATWFIWGSMYLAIKWALVSFPPFFQMGAQFMIAGLLLALLSRWRREPWPDGAQWLAAGVLGALLLGGGFGFTAMAETSVSSGLVVAFGAVVPALVVLAELPYGKRPQLRQVLGVALGLVGIVLLSQGQGFGSSPLGLLWMSIACGTWVLGSIWTVYGLPGGRALSCAPGYMGYASQMVAGGLLLLFAAWLVGERPELPPQPVAMASLLYLMVAGSLVGYTAYMLLLRHTTPSLAASYTYVNPVVALMLGVLLDNESVSPLEYGAVGAILLGVLMLLRSGRQASSA
jgi:drug/metabolite transporter (DMT)-like permease